MYSFLHFTFLFFLSVSLAVYMFTYFYLLNSFICIVFWGVHLCLFAHFKINSSQHQSISITRFISLGNQLHHPLLQTMVHYLLHVSLTGLLSHMNADSSKYWSKSLSVLHLSVWRSNAAAHCVHVRHFKQPRSSSWKHMEVGLCENRWVDGWMDDRQMDEWRIDKWVGWWIARWVHRWICWWTDYVKDGGEAEEEWNELGGLSSDELMNKWAAR